MQRLARAEGRTTGGPVATQAYLTRQILDSFLARLSTTGHASQFVLKGGLLMGAYAVRRPTKDVDSNAMGVRVSEESLTRIAQEVAALDIADGVAFNAGRLTLETIREQVGYRGIRLRMPATIGSARGELAWDVSSGDPIVPPRVVQASHGTAVGALARALNGCPPVTLVPGASPASSHGLGGLRTLHSNVVDALEVVGAVIIQSGRVYCAQRASGPLAGLWEFPGGKVEPGESPRAALAREIREELGCVVKVGSRIERTTHTYEFATITLTTFQCVLQSGQPKALQHSDSRWVRPECLAGLDWASADLPAARRVQATYGRGGL